jgi:hypothetical protein
MNPIVSGLVAIDAFGVPNPENSMAWRAIRCS